jgi:hypothetical protein
MCSFNVFRVRALYHTKTLITNKGRKGGLSSIVTHSYMFRPCWVIFRENFFVIVTLRLRYIVERECAVPAGPGPQRVHASENNAVHSQRHILTQV